MTCASMWWSPPARATLGRLCRGFGQLWSHGARGWRLSAPQASSVDDIQAIILAPGTAPMAQAELVTHRTRVRLADTGQWGNVAKSTLWLLLEPPGLVVPLTLGGVPHPLLRELKHLGVG